MRVIYSKLVILGVIAYSLIFLKEINALSCIICAEGNLDEFGECSNAFEHDCSNYERRNPNQNIFCRTTRSRASNGTYSLVKECITETTHYVTFPRTKSFNLDEECDVVDIDGVEVAYCLCKTGDFCNRPEIVDQFTAFENKYPEFFEPVPSESKSDNDDDGNDFLANKAFSAFGPSETQLKQAAEHELFAAVEDTRNLTTLQRPSSNVPIQPITPSNFHPNPPSNLNRNSVAHSANIFSNAVPFSQQKNSESVSLSCMQCSEANLPNIRADCKDQVMVNCPKSSGGVGRMLCFSRQIITTKGEYGVEKMCVPEKAVIEEFGDDAVLDGCQSIESTSIVSRYCVCSTSNCNRPSVPDQMVFGKGKTGESTTDDLPINEAGLKQQISKLSTVNNKENDLSCSVCLDTGLTNAMQDCRKSDTIKCHFDNGQRQYCLTRQTQNGKDSFIIEKRCVTEKEFFENFPEEKKLMVSTNKKAELTPKCASTYDGYVNFCVCDQDLCNRNSLPKQAEDYTTLRSTKLPTENDFNGLRPIQPINNKQVKSGSTVQPLPDNEIFPVLQQHNTKSQSSSIPTTDPQPSTVNNNDQQLLFSTKNPHSNNHKDNSQAQINNNHQVDQTNERLERWKASMATTAVPDSAESLLIQLRHTLLTVFSVMIALYIL